MLAAQEVLAKPLMWSKLKEVPWAGQIRLENLAEQPALFLTATLTSEPVEFDLKVIRAGKPASTGEAPVEFRLDAEPVEQTFGATSQWTSGSSCSPGCRRRTRPGWPVSRGSLHARVEERLERWCPWRRRTCALTCRTTGLCACG